MAQYKINIDRQLMNRAALWIVERIKKRTREGIDRHGKPFDAYSTNPFIAPAGAFSLGVQKTLQSENGLEYFTRKNKSKWVVIINGYKSVRQAAGLETKPNLTFSGNMLRSLGVVSTGKNFAKIGFLNREAAIIASYHELTGAGKRQVKRQFMGLSPADVADFEKWLSNQPGNAFQVIKT